MIIKRMINMFKNFGTLQQINNSIINVIKNTRH